MEIEYKGKCRIKVPQFLGKDLPRNLLLAHFGDIDYFSNNVSERIDRRMREKLFEF